ncbi:MAG: trypsin-like peptidase domain-containing protein [Patescibacteria group bacterium]|nr:trypsin-like peptidase domain-containing protein [Patescibacteria group bacterium]
MSDKKFNISLNKTAWVVVGLIVTAAVASVFGAVAGFIAANSRVSESLAQNLPPVVRHILTPSQGEKPTGEKYTLPEIRQALKPTPTQEQAVVDVVKRAGPAVVSIVVSKDMPVWESTGGNSDFFQQFFGNIPGLQFEQPQAKQKGTQKQEIGAGSGFIVSADGYIITNRHVVSDESAEYTVVLTDESKHVAKVIGRDSVNDLAVLKIEGQKLPFLTFADSDKIQVGQSVVAIGYALGRFGNTVSTGIVSGLQRSLTAGDGLGSSENLFDVIQTDAAINPGNSGGPLLNLKGEVIGVNVAIVQGSQNIGFALPANDVSKVYSGVQATGRITRPLLGVRFQPVTKELQTANQLPVDYGAIVVRGETPTDLAVMPGSPADLAGIVENDIILEIDGQKITEEDPLQAMVAKYNVGDTIKLKILHKGQEKIIEVKLVERK